MAAHQAQRRDGRAHRLGLPRLQGKRRTDKEGRNKATRSRSHPYVTLFPRQDPPLPSPSGFGRFACDGCVHDWVNGARTVRELYEIARDVNGKFSVSAPSLTTVWRNERPTNDPLVTTNQPPQVPVLWDKRLGTIVNNEVGRKRPI